MTSEAFNDTFLAALDVFCPNGNCVGVDVSQAMELDFEKLMQGDFSSIFGE